MKSDLVSTEICGKEIEVSISLKVQRSYLNYSARVARNDTLRAKFSCSIERAECD